MSKLVEAKRFSSEAEARIAQTFLKANGLNSIVRSVDSAGASGFADWSDGEGAVLVGEEQLEKAQRLLRSRGRSK